MTALLTIDEVAEVLAIPKATLYGQRSRGQEPGSLGLRVGAHVRFHPDDLAADIDRLRAQQRSQTEAS